MNPPPPLPIGLFFGSFNPLHNGHVAIADYLLEHGYCREIWFVVSPLPDSLFAEMEREPWRKQYLLGKLTDMKYVTLRHRGYPFIMYGRKNPLQAVALPGVAMRKEYVVPDIPEALVSDKPVDYYVDVENKYLMPNNPGAFIHVHFVLRDGYHLYTPAAVNRDFIPTRV